MGWKRAEGFVLRAIPLGEGDRIVSLFTCSEGKIRAVAKGARRSRKRFGGSLESLTRVQVTYFEREGADLARLESCEILESHFVLQQSSLEITYTLSYLVELVDHFAREREAEPHFFRLLVSCLAAAKRGATPVLLARYFELWTLRLHGLLPEFRLCGRCGRKLGGTIVIYQPGTQDLFCATCGKSRIPGGIFLRAPELGWIRRALGKAPSEVCGSSPAGRPGPALAKFTRQALEGFLEHPLRTYRFLPAGNRV